MCGGDFQNDLYLIRINNSGSLFVYELSQEGRIISGIYFFQNIAESSAYWQCIRLEEMTRSARQRTGRRTEIQ